MKQDFNINSVLQFMYQSHVLTLKLPLRHAVVTKRQKDRNNSECAFRRRGQKGRWGTEVSTARTETTNYNTLVENVSKKLAKL